MAKILQRDKGNASLVLRNIKARLFMAQCVVPFETHMWPEFGSVSELAQF